MNISPPESTARLPARFAPIAATFGRNGGLVTAQDAYCMARLRSSRSARELSHRIGSNDVVRLTEHARIWLPLFQFDPHTMSVRHEVKAVIDELQQAFDAWEIASWFVQSNSWLGNRAPVAVIDEHPIEVLESARADRFIAAG